MVIYITEIKDDTFKEFVSGDKLSLIDFHAIWCSPCKQISPIIDQLSIDYLGKVSVGKLNVDDCPKVSNSLDIRSIPTIILFKNGEIVDRIVGMSSKQKISEMIDKYL